MGNTCGRSSDLPAPTLAGRSHWVHAAGCNSSSLFLLSLSSSSLWWTSSLRHPLAHHFWLLGHFDGGGCGAVTVVLVGSRHSSCSCLSQCWLDGRDELMVMMRMMIMSTVVMMTTSSSSKRSRHPTTARHILYPTLRRHSHSANKPPGIIRCPNIYPAQSQSMMDYSSHPYTYSTTVLHSFN